MLITSDLVYWGSAGASACNALTASERTTAQIADLMLVFLMITPYKNKYWSNGVNEA
jgi:hypothetical protein